MTTFSFMFSLNVPVSDLTAEEKQSFQTRGQIAFGPGFRLNGMDSPGKVKVALDIDTPFDNVEVSYIAELLDTGHKVFGPTFSMAGGEGD